MFVKTAGWALSFLLLFCCVAAGQSPEGIAVERGDLQRTGVYASPPVAARGDKLWQSDKLFVISRRSVQRPNAILDEILGRPRRMPNGFDYSTPLIHDGVIYFSLFIGDGYLFAVDAATGKLEWKSTRPQERFTPLTIVGEMLYVGCGSSIHAIELKTRREIWNFPVDEAVSMNVAPLLAEGLVFAGTSAGKFYALDAETGGLKWSFRADKPGDWRPPVYGDGTIYCAQRDGAIHALNAATGAVRWELNSGKGVRSLLLSGNKLIFADYERDIHAVDRVSGTEHRNFAKKSQAQTALAATAGKLYFGGPDSGGMFAIDSQNGTKSWEYKTFGYCQEPAIAGDVLYAICSNQKVFALETATGKKIWSKDTGQQTVSAPAIADGVLYFIADDGRVHAIK